ncbi:type VII toxin-antitoxin system MntA family adenylyltransferase antitoxin [Pseudonocardia nigra]|uniref:type VII toxin-antitoxin system MntA family adenylyltransferase antitoxin n=1 Tax=Pseudonocardia nigra TaxID=1921578 RepID=UPI001C5F4980|nr:nucleotidyltransferase domain-containing protein [Pseudonocardia nigra]
MTPEQIGERLREDPATAGLRLAVLHGSRARGTAGAHSDWDIGVLAPDGDPDLAALTVAITRLLGTDAVDVVDLATASALLRYRAARDGVPLLEGRAGEFQEFQIAAAQFWCDAGPVIRAAQDDVLAGLG